MSGYARHLSEGRRLHDANEHIDKRQRRDRDDGPEDFIILRGGGTHEATRLINFIIENGDTRLLPLRDSTDILKFKDTKRPKKGGIDEGSLPPLLVAIGFALYNLARHIIVKKMFTHPRGLFSEILKSMKRLVCHTHRIMQGEWFDLFITKTWDSLTRFHVAQRGERCSLFMLALRGNGENLVCGALDNISFFHNKQPLLGRIASIGDVNSIQMFSISKRMFDNPEQYVSMLETSQSPEMQWMESLCESTNTLLGTVTDKLQLLVAALAEAEAQFKGNVDFVGLDDGPLKGLLANDNVYACLQSLAAMRKIPDTLQTSDPDFDLKKVASRVEKTLDKWSELKSIVEKAPTSGDSNVKLSQAQKNAFKNNVQISRLFGGTPSLSSSSSNSSPEPGVFSEIRTAFADLNQKLWSSEFHLLFLGFQSKHGGSLQPIEFWYGTKANVDADYLGTAGTKARLYPKDVPDFLQLFTPEYVGCIYKWMSHFIFNRPALHDMTTKKLMDLHYDSDTEHYVRLARFQIEKTFGNQLTKTRNLDFFRMIYKTYHEDFSEEDNIPSINASNQYLPSTAILTGWEQEESD